METKVEEPQAGVIFVPVGQKAISVVILKDYTHQGSVSQGSFGKFLNLQIARSNEKIFVVSSSDEPNHKFIQKAASVIATSEKTQLVIEKTKALTVCFSRVAWKIAGKFNEEIPDSEVLQTFIEKAKLKREFAILEVTSL